MSKTISLKCLRDISRKGARPLGRSTSELRLLGTLTQWGTSNGHPQFNLPTITAALVPTACDRRSDNDAPTSVAVGLPPARPRRPAPGFSLEAQTKFRAWGELLRFTEGAWRSAS
jgi:hypothetical protein